MATITAEGAGVGEGMTEALTREAVSGRVSVKEPEWLRERRAGCVGRLRDARPCPPPSWRSGATRTCAAEARPGRAALGSAERPARRPRGVAGAAPRGHGAGPGGLRAPGLIDGAVVHTDIRTRTWPSKGVTSWPAAGRWRTSPELLEEYLATEAVPPVEGKFAALNAALWTDGIFLHVPRGVRLENPVRVTRWFSQAGAAFFSRTLIVAETAPGLVRGRDPLRRPSRGPDARVLGRGGPRPGRRAGPVRGRAAPGRGALLPVGAAHAGAAGLHAGHAQREPGWPPRPAWT